MRLIDADALRASVLEWENCYNGFSDAYDKARIIDAIDEQPTVKPSAKDCLGCNCPKMERLVEPRRGEWKQLLTNYENYHVYGSYSKCGKRSRINNYCPWCGAKMSPSEDLMTEFNKLENYLKKANCPYERIDTNDFGLEKHMIFVPNEKNREWDCICFPGSFGYKDGLLEIMGNIVEEEDDVEGYLTADDVIQRIEKVYGWSYSHDK